MGCNCESKPAITKVDTIPLVNSKWTFNDHLGSILVRLSISRNTFKVEPGLYKIGEPDEQSEVLVSANYKLSFDVLRRNLEGMNAWILVLDTRGINVWCAAGKGTFGTMELISKIYQTGLGNIVTHRRLIVPQLGAPGIAAHEVKESTGFKVKYGPVRAEDIKDFVAAKYKANEKMRTVKFDFVDRLLLSPVELANSLKYLLITLLAFGVFASASITENSLQFDVSQAILPIEMLLVAYISGAFLSPILLPWIPFRYFAAKGMMMGFITFVALCMVAFPTFDIIALSGWLLVSLAISSFLTMNFTGASTYTSLSGVKKEMKLFVPVQLGFTGFGIVLLIISKFVAP